MSPSRIAEGRDERERCAREAARKLAAMLGELDAVAALMATAGDPALYNRSRSIRSSVDRLQVDVAAAVGDLVRERVVEEIAAQRTLGSGRKLSVA